MSDNKFKYMILVLAERNGDFEYYHRSVHKIPNIRTGTMKKKAKEYIEEFYDDGALDKDKDVYYFYGGEVCVRIDYFQAISSKEYNILNQYL